MSEKKDSKESSEDAKAEQESKHGEIQGGNDEDEPDLVASNASILIGNQGLKVLQLGAPGLRQELLRCQGLLLDGLKRRGSSYSKDREGRRAWESSVRSAEDIQELRSATQELEAVVRSVQGVEDENDEAEAEREKVEARAAMLTEGWRFDELQDETEDSDSIKNQLQFIGRKLRRFFRGHGKSDGIIVGYLPAIKNEGMELWRMEHQDGDEEDLDKDDVEKSIRWYEENLLEDDEATTADDENDDDDDLTGESEGSERVEGEASATLWPTAGVRMRWLEALQRSKTVSEVAMALSTFMDHSRAFGIMDDSDSAEGRSSKSESKGGRRAAPAPGPSPYKRKGKSSVSDTHNEGGRARRAAARTVLSYAE